MRDEETAFEDMFPSAEVLAARLAEAYAERDALRAENNRLRNEVAIMAAELCRADMRDMLVKRLTRAAQSLHRAWKRERDLVERYQRDHDEWMWNTDTCDCAICDEVRDRKSLRSDARDGIVTRLRAFVGTLRADGLDIDDPDTAPAWTGKIHDADGRLLFDLATARREVVRHEMEPDERPAIEAQMVALDAEMEGRTP